MKVLSMTVQRLQDQIDAQKLLRVRDDLNIERVHEQLALITKRGFHRDQDLASKLETLVKAVAG